MTNVAKCMTQNCEREAAIDSPLCRIHKELLERIEKRILTDATRAIRLKFNQFERLSLIEPPLHSAEIAFRMAESMKEVRGLLKRFKDERA